jgi:diguanylate cyclase (GGDEF)-like protein/PAS domain S-box-containing protein
MTLQAKFFAFVAPVLMATAAVPPVLWLSEQDHPLPAQVIAGAILLCVGLIVTALVVVYLAAAFLVCRPMRKMAQEMNRIAAGEQISVLTQAARADELGLAARAFNQMADSWQWTSKALIAANTNLEKRVNERTAAIEHAERKYRSIFEHATVGIFQSTLEGRCLSANPAMLQLIGLESEAQALAMTDAASRFYARPEDRRRFLAQLQEFGRVDQFETQLVRGDQSRAWVSLSAQLVRDEDGNPMHIQGFASDITQARLQRQLHRQSEAEANKLALVASRTHNPIVITDSHGKLEWANEAFINLTGYSFAELIGQKPGRLLQGADTDPATVEHMRDCIRRGAGFQVEIINYSRAGRKYWMRIDAEPVRGPGGQIEHYIATEEDVTQRKLADWLEQDRRQFLEMIARDEPLSQTLQAICRAAERQWEDVRGLVVLNDGPRREVAAAPRLSAAFVLGIDSLLNQPAANATPLLGEQPAYVSDITTDLRLTALHAPANQEGIVACNSIPILAGSGKPLGILVLFHEKCLPFDDDSLRAVQSLASLCGLAIEHHQLIARLEYDAVHDPLTALPNRAQLDAQLPKWISSAARHDRLLSLMMIDLDGFKTVNDTLGHHVGDVLLRQVAERLTGAIRESDVLVRTGGDEFTLVATEIASPADATTVAERLVESLAAPFVIEGRELFVSASIGTAIYPLDGMDGAGLQRCAESAMYAAKADGRNCARRFDPKMGAVALERLELESQLRRAVSQNEFLLEYQPQLNPQGKIVGVEALIRWQHPQLGRISPAKFIPVAEACGLVLPIGYWVLDEACRQAMKWQTNGCGCPRMAVNVSALQFQQDDFLDILKATLIDTGLPPQFLELELTESLLLASTKDAIEKLAAVRALGVGVAIDDFGTGYSSLAYLQKLPIDRLKIDQSFVRDLGMGETISPQRSHQAVITAIASMAASMGMAVTAEGVETPAQRDYLIQIGCDTLQGYLFSRPVRAERVEDMLRQQQATEVACAA